jgi:F-type H+-transporting ATPase subunit b
MAGNTTKIIIVAQAESGDALQEGVVVQQPEGEHAVEGAAAEGEHAAERGTVAGTEAHGEEAAFPPFDATYFGPQLFWLALTFIALYVVMSRVALPRIGNILESRRVRIDGDLKEAERLRVETERALAAYEQALAEARTNAHGIAEETRSGIKADLEGKRSKVEADLGRKLAAAEARILKTKTEALTNVDQIAAETVEALVGKLTGKITAKQARDAVALVVKE